MAINKVVYGGNTLLDLTQDTVDATRLLAGYTAHGKDGEPITGTLTFIEIHSGSSIPDDSLGNDGDIYLQFSSPHSYLGLYTHEELSNYTHEEIATAKSWE